MEPTTTRPHPLHCGSYHPGHETHFIPVLRVYPDAPRHPVTLKSVTDDGWLTLDQDGEELRLWHHDVDHVKRLRQGQWNRVGDSTFLTSGNSWVCCGRKPSPCPTDEAQADDLTVDPVTFEELFGRIVERGGFFVGGADLELEPTLPEGNSSTPRTSRMETP